MAGMSATDIASLELEGVQEVINDLTLDDKQLDTYSITSGPRRWAPSPTVS